jgi:acyl-CoA hydrolase
MHVPSYVKWVWLIATGMWFASAVVLAATVVKRVAGNPVARPVSASWILNLDGKSLTTSQWSIDLKTSTFTYDGGSAHVARIMATPAPFSIIAVSDEIFRGGFE